MPRHFYHERDYAFGQTMFKLRSSIGLTQAGLANLLGAPRRLFTSGQGCTGAGAGPAPDETVEASRQAGQMSGQRGDAADGGASCA